MLSEEARRVIERMKADWADKPALDSDKRPQLAVIEEIYAERARVDNPKRIVKVPDKISMIPEMADGVYGEWLRYLEKDPEKRRDKVILFLHGGGFQTGSCLSRREMASKISVCGKLDTFIINYRLAPEYKFPAGLDDCVTAFLWLLKKGYNPKDITVVGESAGANLCLCMSHYLRDHYLPMPGKIVPFSPVVELADMYESRITKLPKDALMGRNASKEEIEEMLRVLHSGRWPAEHALYVTEEEGKSPYASPIRGDFYVFPQILIEVGGDEILYDDACALYEKAKSQGADVRIHVWDELFHVFALFDMPETEAVLQEIADFATSRI